MLLQNEIRDYEFKRGIGYSKKSVDEFVLEMADAYEELRKENIELKDKATALSEGLQYYKSIEKTLQKALVLAQKTADEEEAKAVKNAKVIEKVAYNKADEVITKAKADLDSIFRQTDELNRRFELYKSYVKNLVTTQLELINSDAYNISVNDLDGYLKLKEELEEVRQLDPDDEKYHELKQASSEENKDENEEEKEAKSLEEVKSLIDEAGGQEKRSVSEEMKIEERKAALERKLAASQSASENLINSIPEETA